MEIKEKQTPSGLKIAIIVLSVLLVLSVGGLAARCIYLAYFSPVQSTVTVSDNIIGKDNAFAFAAASDLKAESLNGAGAPRETAYSSNTMPMTLLSLSSVSTDKGDTSAEDKPASVTIELYKNNPSDNEKFTAQNLFPGDIITKSYCVKVYHNDEVTLIFKPEVTDQIKNLGDILNIKVTHVQTGNVLCNAPFNQVKDTEFPLELAVGDSNETTVDFTIEVSLATSVGNEYMLSSLNADFNWMVSGDDDGSLVPPEPEPEPEPEPTPEPEPDPEQPEPDSTDSDETDKTPDKDDGPQTGDNTNLLLWIVVALSALVVTVLLFVKLRKENR